MRAGFSFAHRMGPTAPADRRLEALQRRYGHDLLASQTAHRSEHSIEFQAVLLRRLSDALRDGAVPLLEHNPQMLTKYPQVADQALDEFFRVDGVSKWQKQSNILKMVRKQGMFRMGWDTMKALWTMK